MSTTDFPQPIKATGQPWEVTHQTFVPHRTTPADQQFTEGNNSNGIKLGELIQATSQPWEATQQASIQHGNNPADRTGAHAQADLLPNIYGHDQHHQISTTDFPQPTKATGQSWEVTQQTFVPHETTPADQQLTEGNNSNGIKLGELIQATGQPWEVTQQTSAPHGTTPADQQLTEENNSNGIKLGELTSNPQEIISTIQATGQPWEVTQQTLAQHGQLSADVQRLIEGNTFTGIKIFFHAINPAVMIPAGNPTPINPKPIENYPQPIFMQSYGPNFHASKNFFHEFNLAAMIPAATSSSIYPKPIKNY